MPAVWPPVENKPVTSPYVNIVTSLRIRVFKIDYRPDYYPVEPFVKSSSMRDEPEWFQKWFRDDNGAGV
jgi:hypothetical protein